MSDAEDDYLSDRFLSQPPSLSSNSKPLTYGERRRQAQREAEIKNAQNRKKSRRQLEEESTREGLSKSLFERAKEEQQFGSGQANKAMSIMMKMGFEPGQSLGKVEEPQRLDATTNKTEPPMTSKTSGHLVEPLPLDIWTGRQGVGKRKRAVSPASADRLAKVVKQATEENAHGSYRDRARQDYEERRAEGRLISATRTCITLDEKAEKLFNVLWLNPQDPESFPPELLELLTRDDGVVQTIDLASGPIGNDSLRQQMRADALQPLGELEDDDSYSVSPKNIQQEAQRLFPPTVVNDTRDFIRMSARDRLSRLLTYLRAEYFYCFWCGTQYMDFEDLSNGCPGPDEEAHD